MNLKVTNNHNLPIFFLYKINDKHIISLDNNINNKSVNIYNILPDKTGYGNAAICFRSICFKNSPNRPIDKSNLLFSNDRPTYVNHLLVSDDKIAVLKISEVELDHLQLIENNLKRNLIIIILPLEHQYEGLFKSLLKLDYIFSGVVLEDKIECAVLFKYFDNIDIDKNRYFKLIRKLNSLNLSEFQNLTSMILRINNTC